MTDNKEIIRDSFESMFRMIDPNSKYLPAKTAAFYHLIGGCLIKFPVKQGMATMDMRFSFSCCIASGRGKASIKAVIIDSCKEIDKDYKEFTSIHEEQLIGKRWKDKKTKKTITKYGYLASDFLAKDDALSFLNDKTFGIARDYCIGALDEYGKNYVAKWLTEETVQFKYLAPCSILLFIQPSEKIETKYISSGLFRRVPILRVDLTRKEKDEIRDNRFMMSYNPKQKEWIKFLNFIKIIKTIKYKRIKIGLMKKICVKCKEYNSENILLDSLDNTNQNNIVKFAFIHSLIRYYDPHKIYDSKKGAILEIELEINEDDIDKTVIDYEIIHSAIRRFVKGNDRGLMHPIKEEIINYLELNNCYSAETSEISSPNLIKMISERAEEKISTISYHFYKLKEDGIIETSQAGANYSKISRVWLTKGACEDIETKKLIKKDIIQKEINQVRIKIVNIARHKHFTESELKEKYKITIPCNMILKELLTDKVLKLTNNIYSMR